MEQCPVEYDLPMNNTVDLLPLSCDNLELSEVFWLVLTADVLALWLPQCLSWLKPPSKKAHRLELFHMRVDWTLYDDEKTKRTAFLSGAFCLGNFTRPITLGTSLSIWHDWLTTLSHFLRLFQQQEEFSSQYPPNLPRCLESSDLVHNLFKKSCWTLSISFIFVMSPEFTCCIELSGHASFFIFSPVVESSISDAEHLQPRFLYEFWSMEFCYCHYSFPD
jgi:hypothetical protein